MLRCHWSSLTDFDEFHAQLPSTTQFFAGYLRCSSNLFVAQLRPPQCLVMLLLVCFLGLVSAGASNFVVVGSGGAVLTSSDAVTFSQASVSATFHSVALAPSFGYVAVGRSPMSTAFSVDGAKSLVFSNFFRFFFFFFFFFFLKALLGPLETMCS
jgi:hypothetical protein